MNIDDLFESGGIVMLTVAHDDWCKTLKTGVGADCNCNPVESVETLKGADEIEKYFKEGK